MHSQCNFAKAAAYRKGPVGDWREAEESCSIWARELKSGCCGTLEKKSDHIWSTINTPAVKDVWPTSHEESVTNAVVLRSTAVYDHLKKQLSSSLYQLGNCDIKKGSCVAGNRVHFWDVPKRLECPNVQKVKSVHNISLHSDMRGNVYRLEVKTLGISLHSQIQCPTPDKRRTRDTTGGPLVMTWCSMLQRAGCGVRVGSKAPGYVEKISSRRTSFLTIGSTEADVVASTVQLCKGCVPHHSQIHVPHHKRRFGRQTGSGRRGRIRVWIGKGSCSCNRDCGHMRELIMVHSFYLTVA